METHERKVDMTVRKKNIFIQTSGHCHTLPSKGVFILKRKRHHCQPVALFPISVFILQ